MFHKGTRVRVVKNNMPGHGDVIGLEGIVDYIDDADGTVIAVQLDEGEFMLFDADELEVI